MPIFDLNILGYVWEIKKIQHRLPTISFQVTSPKMEPSPQRQVQNTKPKVCRQLFFSDKPSNEDYLKTMEEHLHKDLEEKKMKWNFDFTNDRMVSEDGTYIWTETNDNERYDYIGTPNHNYQVANESDEPKDNGDLPKINDESHSDKNIVESESNNLENVQKDRVDT
nr:cyclin-dependent kinase inhibitor 1B-like [Plodia interpunctella]